MCFCHVSAIAFAKFQTRESRDFGFDCGISSEVDRMEELQ